MARYKITSLNYMNVGTNRVFFNFDMQVDYTLKKEIYNLRDEENTKLIASNVLGSQIIISEYDEPSQDSSNSNEYNEILRTEDELTLITDPDINNGEKIIRPIKRTDTEQFYSNIVDFNENNKEINSTFIAEFTQINNKNTFQLSNTQYTPLYNIKDVSIKSDCDLFYQNEEIDSEDTYMNIYAPDMTSNPIQFCQINFGTNTNTFLLTPTTKYGVYNFSSSLLNKRENNSQRMHLSYYDMQLTNNKTELLIYGDITSYNCDSLSNYMNTHDIDEIDIFEPVKSITNVDRNYIMIFPDSKIVTDYDSGNINANLYPCKNHMNSVYEMEISHNKITHNRNYCGLNQSGDILYLKYYDDRNYNLSYKNMDNGLSVIDAIDSSDNTVPYQKIESFQSVAFTNRRKHKSNLFSIRISDLNDISEVSQKENQELSKMRDEIYSAIKDIVKNVCPVNTQLFKVYFGNR